ncbi:HalX domain-containing protein [Halobacteriaceae archaeon GCM10025711]
MLALVHRLQTRRYYDDRLQEYFGVVTRLAVLETELPEQDLEATGEYRALLDKAETMREQLADVLQHLDGDDAFLTAVKESPHGDRDTTR